MSKGREGSDHRPNSQLPGDAVTGNVGSFTLPAVISLGGNRKGVSTCGHASRRYLYTWRTKSKFWCRGPESNWLRPPFQGGALPMSYPGTFELFNFRDDGECCQFGARREISTTSARFATHSADWSNSRIQLRFLRTSRGLVPSGGPTMPSFSIKSMSRAARP